MRTQVAAVMFGLATLVSTAPAQVAQRPASSVTTDTLTNTVTVQNDRNGPVTIYMDYGPFDRRLGTVPAWQTETLPLLRGRSARQRISCSRQTTATARSIPRDAGLPRRPGRIGWPSPRGVSCPRRRRTQIEF